MANIEELKREMHALMDRIGGLQAIIVSDREGVPIIKVSHELAPELSLRPTFLSSFGVGSDQASKLGIGLCRTMTCQYENYQVISFTKEKIMVVLIANNKANTGMLLALENEFDGTCEELKKIVKEER